jgi:glycosyltransferase involved in cell wall biosynthesis
LSSKPNILIFIDWFLPGFKAGGPIKSVSNIVNSLHKDFNFFIITSDRDIDDEKPYATEQLDKWVEKKYYQIAYLSERNRINFITKTIQENSFDTFYFNSFFSKKYTLDPLSLVKKTKSSPQIIIAPRGMLGKGALKIKSLKKSIFLTIAKLIGIYNNVIWHATDNGESEDIQAIFGNNSNIIITPNISIFNISESNLVKNENELRLVFFSRIARKKNLFFCLDILNNFREQSISLDIYGSIEDLTYWKECEDFIFKNNLKVKYISKLNPQDVQSTLSNYHFLFFPTFHENYGHVIVEALSAGCGLILSNNTPWRNLCENKIGWDISLDNKKEFINVIEKCYQMNQEEYSQYRKNCYNYIKNETIKHNSIELTKKMFSQ